VIRRRPDDYFTAETVADDPPEEMVGGPANQILTSPDLSGRRAVAVASNRPSEENATDFTGSEWA
jgi:hypothetical protein